MLNLLTAKILIIHLDIIIHLHYHYIISLDNKTNNQKQTKNSFKLLTATLLVNSALLNKGY